GSPRTTVGFDTPLPDFTDCSQTSREAALDWKTIVHGGGPARGFSEIMPSFSEALTGAQIDKAVEYLRGFCVDRWPRGELNLPRAFFTEKAFPEDEAVVTTAINASGPAGVENHIAYERRFGVANQVELDLPFTFQQAAAGNWTRGVGDVTLGYKRVLAYSLRSGSIFSLGGEVNLPTGDRAKGLGSGVTIFEPFASY